MLAPGIAQPVLQLAQWFPVIVVAHTDADETYVRLDGTPAVGEPIRRRSFATPRFTLVP